MPDCFGGLCLVRQLGPVNREYGAAHVTSPTSRREKRAEQ
jgi:hypothetical protein